MGVEGCVGGILELSGLRMSITRGKRAARSCFGYLRFKCPNKYTVKKMSTLRVSFDSTFSTRSMVFQLCLGGFEMFFPTCFAVGCCMLFIEYECFSENTCTEDPVLTPSLSHTRC